MRISIEAPLTFAFVGMATLMAGYFVHDALGWIGVGLLGLLMLFVAIRVELERAGPVGSAQTTGLFASTFAAREQMSRAEREAERIEVSATLWSTRFAKLIGAALAVLGLGGFLLFQLPH